MGNLKGHSGVSLIHVLTHLDTEYDTPREIKFADRKSFIYESFIYIADIMPLLDGAVGNKVSMGCCSEIAGYDRVWLQIQSQTCRNLKICDFGNQI